MKLSNPQLECALLAYIGLNGLAGLEGDLITEGDFIHQLYRPLYGCALAVHRKGKLVNQFSINEEAEAAGLAEQLQREALTGDWSDWMAHADTSLQMCGPTVAREGLRDIHRFALNRERAKIGRQLADNELEADEAEERLRGLREGSRTLEFSALLSSRRFDSKNPPPAPRTVYEMQRHRICTPGNITVIAAKAKVGKSALIGGIIAASTGGDGDTLCIDSGNPEQHALVHFDTEQSPADHHLLIATAMFRVTRTDHPSWLRSYRVADIPTSQRFDLLEHELRASQRECGGIHSVILDGIADFVCDPNDTKEAFAAVERIHRLAVQYNTAIICVLHINPGSETGKTRGHLGSQLERKAETNLVLEKDDEGVTTVYTTNTRHAFIPKQDGPRFKWSKEAMKHVTCDSARVAREVEHSASMHAIVAEVFGKGAVKWSEMIEGIKAFKGVGQRQAERIQKDLRAAGLIANQGAGLWVKKS